MAAPQYDWYCLATGDDLEQGDILESCPVFLPPESLAEKSLESATFHYKNYDVIVMSQSCDLVKGSEKLSDVLLCAVWKQSELTTGHLATPRGMDIL